MRCLVDTNVALRAFTRQHALHASTSQFLERLIARGDEMCVVPQVLYEYWAVCTRPAAANGLGLSITQAKAGLEEVKSAFLLLRDERAIYEEWERLVVENRVEGRSSYDARLVAAMSRHGVKHIVTFNGRDFARFKDVVVIDPAAPL